MEKVIIWGTGAIAEQIFRDCSSVLSEYHILAVIDNDSKKIGIFFHGIKVTSPETLIALEGEYDCIIVLAEAYREISDQIIELVQCSKEKIVDKNYFYKNSIIKRYQGSKNREIKEIVNYLKTNNISVFNDPFIHNYDTFDVNVYFDSQADLFYIMHGNKRMYFSKDYDSEEKVKEYYKSILLEQDRKSPHRYLDEKFTVHDGDIVVDIGAAEGNFSLEIIDKVKKVYIIESDHNWVEALQFTFAKYIDKVSIIEKYVTSYNEGVFSTLDNLIQKPVNFIKMDIEGNEWDALIGAEKIIQMSRNLLLAVCCYHSDFDQELIESKMDEYGITHTTTDGYMWFPWTIRQTYVSTRLNRAIVRGTKLDHNSI